MTPRVLAPAAALLFAAFSTTVTFAQATKTTPTTSTPAPAAPARWVKPLKGTATVEVIQGPSKRIGNEIVTVLKVKNTSSGPVALLRADETWFDKKSKPVSGDQPKPIRQPLYPGEIVEITFRAPYSPELYQSTYVFSHANGEVKATKVKAFK